MYTIELVGSRGITAEFLHVSGQPPKCAFGLGVFSEVRAQPHLNEGVARLNSENPVTIAVAGEWW